MNNEYNKDINDDFMPTLCSYLKEVMRGNATITKDNYGYIYNALINNIDLKLWEMYGSNNKVLHDIAKARIMNDLFVIADNIRYHYGDKFREGNK